MLLLSTIGSDFTPFKLDSDVEIDADKFNADTITGIKMGDAELTAVADIGPDSLLVMSFGNSGIENAAELTNAFDGVYSIAQHADDAFLTVASYDLDAWTAKMASANVVIGRKVEGIIENGGNTITGAKSFYANESTRIAYIGDGSGNVVRMSFDSLMETELEVNWADTVDTVPGGMVVHSYLAEANFAQLTYVGGKKVLVHYKDDDGNVIELAREDFTQVTMARMTDGKRDYTHFVTIEDGNVIELSPEDITSRLANNTDLQLKLSNQLGGQFGAKDVSKSDTGSTDGDAIEQPEAPQAK